MALDHNDIILGAIATVFVMGASIVGAIGVRSINTRNAAIQTATLAELTGPNAPEVQVKDLNDDGLDYTKASPLPETFYDRRVDGRRCYLAIDGQAVPNTCYSPR